MADDFNAHIIAEFRANHRAVGGNFEGAPILLLHTVGARSGQPRVNPMMYLAEAKTTRLIPVVALTRRA